LRRPDWYARCQRASSRQGCLRTVKMKLIEMSDYNRAAKTYWFVMVATGATLFVWAAQRCLAFSLPQWATFGGLFFLVIVAGAMRIDFLLAGLALMAMLHYFINGFTISTIYALRTRGPILKFWRDGYLWTWWSFLASAIATAVIYSAVSRIGWAYVLLSVPVI